MQKSALITGVTGQDGAYLARYLLRKGYNVFGGVRRSSLDSDYRLRLLEINDEISLINFDLTDPYNVYDTVQSGNFDEIYNLGAQSFVGSSWDTPLQTSQVNAFGTLHLLDAIKRTSPTTRFYQASTSEMFGKIQEEVQSETTPFYPRSPYGVAKQFAHSMTVNYRESFGLHASSGILFNHESPLRGREFVTKKVSTHLAKMLKSDKLATLKLGNLDAKRDWGYAEDYVKGMWLMLQNDSPDDYVLATGKTASVREFVEYCAAYLDWDLGWDGSGVDEVGYDKKTGRKLVEVSEKFFRPAEVDVLLGDPTKAQTTLGWRANVDLEKLSEIMMAFEVRGVL